MTPSGYRFSAILATLLAAVAIAAPAAGDDGVPNGSAMFNDIAIAQAQDHLANEVASEMHAAASKLALGHIDQRILDVMRRLPRHLFVPAPIRPYAYLNRPLPVGHGQTVSQPFIVALMSQMAEIKPNDRVLLVSVGGGYHAALLHDLGADVRVVELLDPVATEARERLASLGYDIKIQVSDGYYGWPAAAPFDAVIVRQALHHIPSPLLKQLKPGGRLVMPVGPPDGPQDLMLAFKDLSGVIHRRNLMPVQFTTLPGGDRI